MKDNHALDAVLHATAPIPLAEVRKLIDEALNRERDEFLEDIKMLDCLGSHDGGCLYFMDSDKCDVNCPNYKLYKKWEAKKNE